MIRLKEQLHPRIGGEDPWACGRCFFCSLPTRYWHEGSMTPVCLGCARSHRTEELPKPARGKKKVKPRVRLKKRKKTS